MEPTVLVTHLYSHEIKKPIFLYDFRTILYFHNSLSLRKVTSSRKRIQDLKTKFMKQAILHAFALLYTATEPSSFYFLSNEKNYVVLS